ncbi:PREDICTED: putative glycerol kinase 5 [Rhagoletis zephyria]|uniref:putative glycerol kinase 5 n=1 Tax=Rhagoletis zephyria TaxID=28612 RepID=UPI00081181B5|nr:PREDICTED: putative glycerol kinase 5 [Rhagoletis zephyria]XP_017488581.1 PREDICTED: putative glycerol kinase 5 [Rhagoletis zephyria]XP_017488582.1 PREDICTED: putative glycerol kinase 5 [Rhagoletis zephyria]XP_017488583.1 PREDICTED: putative glycerol kinase 5 [Rhagoletis zephyria]
MIYIATLDVGTTTVRCFIIDARGEVLGSSTERVKLLNPQPGHFEIEPETLWAQIVSVVNRAVIDAQLKPCDITNFGLSTQRCTFLTWNHETQEYYHNFITWKDLRANTLVDQWNTGAAIKALNIFSYVLYLITRSKRFLAASVLKMMNGQVIRGEHIKTEESNTNVQYKLKATKTTIKTLQGKFILSILQP